MTTLAEAIFEIMNEHWRIGLGENRDVRFKKLAEIIASKLTLNGKEAMMVIDRTLGFYGIGTKFTQEEIEKCEQALKQQASKLITLQ